MRLAATIGIFALAGGAFGQTLAFEAASVKPSGPKSIRNFTGGPGSSDPGRISYTSATLQDVLINAYRLEDVQQISGPGWLGSETYDIVATIPPGTAKEQFEEMLQNLLADRIKLTLHHETRDFPVYELIAGKGGSKLKESAENALVMAGKDGFPQLPPGRPGMSMTYENGRAHLAARQEPISVLLRMLRGPAGRVVVDGTGLTGKYDFILEFGLERTIGPAAPGRVRRTPRASRLRIWKMRWSNNSG